MQLYKKELPAMKYAANTGKESTFLERCVSSGYGGFLSLDGRFFHLQFFGNLDYPSRAITYYVADTINRLCQIIRLTLCELFPPFKYEIHESIART